MNRPARTLCTLAVAACVAVTLASGALAVASFLTAGDWADASKEYRRAYAAGALDMLRALADANYLTSAVRPKTDRLIECVAGKTDGDIAAIFDGARQAPSGRQPRQRGAGALSGDAGILRRALRF